MLLDVDEDDEDDEPLVGSFVPLVAVGAVTVESDVVVVEPSLLAVVRLVPS
jgi:hypothetical protein